MKALNNHKYYLSAGQQVKLFEIAHKMKLAKLSDEFIAGTIRTALEFEGVADLVQFWSEEEDLKEKEEIIADIQDLINDCSQTGREEFTYIKFNDLETIAMDIRIFKDRLLETVGEHGGLKRLSELTKIPQPSLSRFFNSNSMPHRGTLLKIAKALGLDALKIAIPWER